MDVHGFADLWEHVRLLSDRRRNQALLGLLHRHAPGARVLEVGCGSGLLSCIAARLGAKQVYAVEPTAQVELARTLVERNQLHDVVQVIDGMIQEVDPRPVDLAFSELLNADPFAEGLVDAMDAAANWVMEGGRLSPRRLRLWVALVRENTSAREVAEVRQVLAQLSQHHQLDLSPLVDGLDTLEPYRFLSPAAVPVTRSHCVLDLPLGTGTRPPQVVHVEVPVEHSGPVGGALVWFEAEVDDGVWMSNPPTNPGHWGHLLSGWPTEVGGARDGVVSIEVLLDVDEGVVVQPAPRR